MTLASSISPHSIKCRFRASSNEPTELYKVFCNPATYNVLNIYTLKRREKKKKKEDNYFLFHDACIYVYVCVRLKFSALCILTYKVA
jgi:uncharacterized membrane protein SirB2